MPLSASLKRPRAVNQARDLTMSRRSDAPKAASYRSIVSSTAERRAEPLMSTRMTLKPLGVDSLGVPLPRARQ